MNPYQCCRTTTPDRSTPPGLPSRRPTRWWRGREFASWLIPGATLVLLPKCPICMAAYVALFTGIGISIVGASILRTSLLVLCIATLLCLGLKRLRRLVARNKTHSLGQNSISRHSGSPSPR